MSKKKNSINVDDSFWIKVKDLLQKKLDENKNALNSGTIEGVQHFLDHDEYEMAYEGLLLDLMELNDLSYNICCDDYIWLGKELKLDKESVLSSDFWTSYMQYCKERE